MMNEYIIPTREDLIALCDRGVVPQSEWYNRDSADAQIQLATARTLLASGCEYRVEGEEAESDEDTWWVEITYRGFDYFENNRLTKANYYIPTAAHLDKMAGKDWY